MGYTSINIFCAIIIGMVLIYFERSRDDSSSARLLRVVLILVFLLCFADAGWYYSVSHHHDYSTVDFDYVFDACIYSLDFFISVWASYDWFMYVDKQLDSSFTKTKRQTIIVSIPELLVFALTLLSIKFNLFFDMDADGYHRGFAYPLFFLIVLTYLLVASGHAFSHSFRAKDPNETRRCRTLASFILFPVLAGVAQIFIDLPFTTGIVLGVIWMFLEIQRHDISEDSLTGLNNRNRLDRELALRMDRSRETGRRLFLFMMDADYFKSINDAYGHTEGDIALKSLGRALKMSVAGTGNFIARFGGDEFSAIMFAETEAAVRNFRTTIKETIDKECNSNPNQLYRLSLSIGFAEFDPEYTIEEFYAAADRDLYQQKQIAHARHEKIGDWTDARFE